MSAVLDPIGRPIGNLWIDQTATEISAGVTPTAYQYPTLYVDRYGTNTTPGTTDMTTALRAAVSVASAAGGGTIHFLPGATYLLSTEGTHSVVVPIAGADYTDSTESHQYNVLLDGLDRITFDLHGATIQSDTTNGGAIFILDSCRNIWFRNGKIKSVHAHNSSGTDTTTGMHAIEATSQDRDSYGIKLTNLEVEDAYSTLYCFGTMTATYRLRGVDVENVFHNKGHYSLAFHENGDNVTVRGYHARDCLRDYFVYGVNQHNVQISSAVGVAGFRPLVKAYRNDTKNIKVRYTTTKSLTGGSHFGLESDYDTGTQATPKKLLGVEIDIDNSGGQVLPAVEFAVYRDGVLVNATTQVFHGIVLRGLHQNAPTISSTQDNGSLNTDGVVVLSGGLNSIYDATGFYDSKQQYNSFTPVMRVNNSTTGITFGTRVGEYWRDGRFIEALYDVTLTSKGASVGDVTFDLPITSSTETTAASIIVSVIASNMAALPGPIVGWAQTSGDGLILELQGAAGLTNLADTNLTNTSRLQIHIRYPIW